MKIEDAKMWRYAYSVAQACLKEFLPVEDDAMEKVQYMIMCAYVEGVKDAQDYQKSAT